MTNTLKPKRSTVAGRVPTTSMLTSGEIGVNMADQKIYINNGTTVVQVGSGTLSGMGDVALTSLASGQVLQWNGTNWVNVSAGSGNVVNGAATDLVANQVKIGVWTGGSTYRGLFHSSMTGSEYALIMGDTDPNTYISAKTGGVVVLRGGNNTTTYELRVPGSSRPTVAGNVMLDAGNYGSYAPSLTGGGASGTWGINITGSAASITGTYGGTLTSSQVTTALGFTPYNAGTNTVLTNANYNSYALPLNGGTLSVSSGGGIAINCGAAGNYGTLSIGNASYSTYFALAGAAGNYSTLSAVGDAVVRGANGVCISGNNGTGGVRVDSSGNLTASANVTAYSDERLKKDWADLPADFIERLAKIKHGTYTRTDTQERQAGASAQDWQKLLPEVVIEGKHLSLAYGNAALVSAIKLAERVLALESRLAQLENH